MQDTFGCRTSKCTTPILRWLFSFSEKSSVEHRSGESYRDRSVSLGSTRDLFHHLYDHLVLRFHRRNKAWWHSGTEAVAPTPGSIETNQKTTNVRGTLQCHFCNPLAANLLLSSCLQSKNLNSRASNETQRASTTSSCLVLSESSCGSCGASLLCDSEQLSTSAGTTISSTLPTFAYELQIHQAHKYWPC